MSKYLQRYSDSESFSSFFLVLPMLILLELEDNCTHGHTFTSLYDNFFLDDINSSMVTMNSFDETITTLSCCRLSIATLQFFSSMIFNADIKLIDTMNSLDALGCQLLLYNFSLLLRKDEIEISFTLNGRML